MSMPGPRFPSVAGSERVTVGQGEPPGQAGYGGVPVCVRGKVAAGSIVADGKGIGSCVMVGAVVAVVHDHSSVGCVGSDGTIHVIVTTGTEHTVNQRRNGA